MTNAVESSAQKNPRLSSLSTVGKVRFGVFTLVVLALLVLNLVMTPPTVLLAAFTGWTTDFGIHQVHDMTVAALMWVLLHAALVLLLYRPTGRVNTVLAPIILEIPVMVFAFLADSFLFMGFVIGSALAAVALLLHPAGRSLLRFDRVRSLDPRIAGVFVIGAVPLLVYSGLELLKQVGPMDEHVLFVHYGATAIAGFYIVIMGGLAVFRQRDWRFAVGSAGIMAAFLGLVSIVFPTSSSSLGVFGGALLTLWAIVFVAAVEYTRRNDAGGEPETIEETGAKPA